MTEKSYWGDGHQLGSSQDAVVLGEGKVQTFSTSLSAQGYTTGYSPAPLPALYHRPYSEVFPALPFVLGGALCSGQRDQMLVLHIVGYPGPRLQWRQQSQLCLPEKGRQPTTPLRLARRPSKRPHSQATSQMPSKVHFIKARQESAGEGMTPEGLVEAQTRLVTAGSVLETADEPEAS